MIVQLVFKTFFEIGSAVSLAVFCFGVIPSVLFYRFVNRTR